jgi:REP element-mobilizing transposase RayT
MLRGINRQTIFEDDRDIERLIDTVKRYKPVSKYELYAYCIMSNHAHFLCPLFSAFKSFSRLPRTGP